MAKAASNLVRVTLSASDAARLLECVVLAERHLAEMDADPSKADAERPFAKEDLEHLRKVLEAVVKVVC